MGTGSTGKFPSVVFLHDIKVKRRAIVNNNEVFMDLFFITVSLLGFDVGQRK
jgi:hypothetical protein